MIKNTYICDGCLNEIDSSRQFVGTDSCLKIIHLQDNAGFIEYKNYFNIASGLHFHDLECLKEYINKMVAETK